MNTSLLARLLTSLLAVMVVVASAANIFTRVNDPAWESMSDVRLNYNLFSCVLIGFGISIMYGLWAQRKWGRTWAMSFSASILALHVGVVIFVYYFFGDINAVLTWDVALVSALSMASLITLSFRRNEYAGGQ